MKKIGIISLIIIIFGTIFVFLQKYSSMRKISAPESVTIVKEKPHSIESNQSPMDWGTVSSAFGFSLKYPYKEVGVMPVDNESSHQISFFFSQESLSSDESIKEKLSSDIHNIGIRGELSISVIEPGKDIIDFPLWVKEFLEGDSSSRKKENTLSQYDSEITFAGQKGYSIIRKIEGPKEQQSPHYTREDIFIYKDKYVYTISRISSSDDTVFPRSGIVGKNFLDYVDALSSKILQTFVFDGSSRTAIMVPKNTSRELTGEKKDRREKLLADLRQAPFFDEQKSYPQISSSDQCSSKRSTGTTNSDHSRELHPSPGVFVSASSAVADEENVAEIHAYDREGNHTGPLPMLPVSDNPTPIEEHARGAKWINLGSFGYGLSIEESMDGKIEIRGKKSSATSFIIRGEGNSCQIAQVLIPVTPYSVATIPMTSKGDFGPISYDIDGDGSEDLQLSLIHPLLPEKEEQFRAVISDMWEGEE
ncbi:MAG: hypothetical protein GW815_03845 [Candidatus Moranbacteria bacterium]|nr:hypothetical protein [Candidatus Moranbacteria bacterium]OIQ04366.1 MAG: hypothetical protein AUK58_00775 [Candidatus Moranbacteria bacterium CG2_30_41_165]PIP26023.1 MAG: hypothetical protein COX32_00210 [Candidatus Moranbacteria bacterium CG23_combo_of_CG06-09_8_20_14_all_41_28]PIV86515.1 MAG: hypothetical protein COW50_00955 [Candidatus Moranbacteria bacterium CG17_big_fil_post_rev_8_21_14_2_50_41_107]PIW93813.1 MAG: hypothetical protein COZ86_04400 [Candidatus Moranbacteria bacterium CG_